MLSKIQSALATLLSPNERVLVGVSGGADSVTLLDALIQCGYRPRVCHLNHQWRGADSEADAKFVQELAGKYGVPATIESRTVEHDEDAGRRARFEFFQSAAARTGIHTIALAHTADDQVETFLLRLLRGAGTTGLAGMQSDVKIGGLRVIRPLLDVRRSEVIEYLRSRQITWREDASNTDRRFLRNRIRHELLPVLERDYNPGIRDALLRTAEILRDEDDLLTTLAGAVPIAELRSQSVALQRRALRLWLGEGLDFDHIEAVRQLTSGAEVTLPGELIVYREGDALRKAHRQDVEPVRGRWPLDLTGETAIRELGVRLVIGDDGERLDADTLGAAPFVRTWENGDRFQPLGMTGEKKLQDFFVDEKVPRLRRGRVPLLCASDGRIAWVVGYRIGEPYKVTGATRRVLRIGVQG